jgi:hypothetical protein
MSLPSELLPVGLLGTGATGGYEIERSLRFNSVDTAYLTNDTAASGGNTTTWTLSMWVKRSSLAAAGSSHQLASAFIIPNNSGSVAIAFDENQKIVFGSYFTAWRITTQVFRDFSAWYHFVFVWDTTNGTSNDRVRMYVNGTRITAFDTNNDPGLNAVSPFCDNQPVEYSNQNIIGKTRSIGVNAWFQLRPFDGYIADVNCVQGQALDPTSFGEFDTNGIWQPIAYDGEYGTNGFHLEFADNSSNTATTLGKDTSGNGNNWTPNNLSVTAGAGNDSLVDVPTNGAQTDTGLGGEVRGNYCTLNPLTTKGGFVLSNGNLKGANVVNDGAAIGTIAVPTTGKWYWEAIQETVPNIYLLYTGITPNADARNGLGNFYGIYPRNGNVCFYGSPGTNCINETASPGDVYGVAYDADAGTLNFYKNGVLYSGQTRTVTTGVQYYPFLAIGNSDPVASINFGQRPFAYTAPSGFKALNTANLPTPTILDGSDYMDVVTYTGNGSTQTISGLEFSPDLVWLKARSAAYGNYLSDTVRGITKDLYSHATNAEYEEPTLNGITAVTSNGFSLGNDIGRNNNTTTYVAWTWDAGSTTVTNTDGSITSSVRANPSAGFSIVTFAAQSSGTATIGHGLGVAPSLIILKSRAQTYDWITYHISNGSTKTIRFNLTEAANTNSIWWNDTTPTSNVFTLGSAYGGAGNCVAYCFAPVEGYSAFGSYTGNGSSDGPFVYTNGFRPRWIMVKRTTATTFGDWEIRDTGRDSYNSSVSSRLFPNSSAAEESSGFPFDVLSNGFKLRTNGVNSNESGQPYIYAAFAENPFALNVRAR